MIISFTAEIAIVSLCKNPMKSNSAKPPVPQESLSQVPTKISALLSLQTVETFYNDFIKTQSADSKPRASLSGAPAVLYTPTANVDRRKGVLHF